MEEGEVVVDGDNAEVSGKTSKTRFKSQYGRFGHVSNSMPQARHLQLGAIHFILHQIRPQAINILCPPATNTSSSNLSSMPPPKSPPVVQLALRECGGRSSVPTHTPFRLPCECG
jgi:hypothetical protein